MLWFWPTVLRPLFDAIEPRLVVEVGSATGHNTRNLLEWASARPATVIHAVDPMPGFDVEDYQARYGDHFVFHRGKSHDVLLKISDADVVLIDGDHNWWTVHRELEILQETAVAAGRPFPVTLLHDVSWPYARRDMYYSYDDIPEEFRHPARHAHIMLGEIELNATKGINGGILNAEVEGTPHNGVLTAVEDFMSECDLELRLQTVCGFAGLGILVAASRLEEDTALRDQFERVTGAEFLLAHSKRLERSMLSLQMVAAERKRDLLAAQRRIAALDKELERVRTIA